MSILSFYLIKFSALALEVLDLSSKLLGDPFLPFFKLTSISSFYSLSLSLSLLAYRLLLILSSCSDELFRLSFIVASSSTTNSYFILKTMRSAGECRVR